MRSSSVAIYLTNTPIVSMKENDIVFIDLLVIK